MITNSAMISAVAKNSHLRNGFYVHGDRIYLSKIQALMDATKENSDIRYYYNDHVYACHPWNKEPVECLDLIYQNHAKHLREKYDHIIVMFSGGSDSTNLLHSFLQADALPDEIWSMVAYTNTCDKLSTTNIEITTAAWPVLQRANAHGIHIQLVNLPDFDDVLADDWFMDAPASRLAPDVMMRKNMFFNNPKIMHMVDAGKKVAFVLGYDKPRLLLDGDQWCFGILDTFWASHWQSQHNLSDGPFLEFFYYSPDSPEILNKSCHMLIDWFEKHYTRDQCRTFFNSDNCRRGPQNIDLYRSIVNRVLYSHSWDEDNTFSLGKNRGRWSTFFDQKCSFVIDNHQHWQNYQTWQQGIDYIQHNLDPKFYTPWQHINGHWTQLYPIRSLRAL